MPDPLSQPLPWLTVGVFLLVSAAIFLAWRSTVIRPHSDSHQSSGETGLVYAAIGASDVEGIGAANPEEESWVNALHRLMPPGTRLVRLGRGGITLGEANDFEVPRAVAAKPDIVTLWNCVNDVNRGIQLPDYVAALERALSALTRGTTANIVLLDLPDLTVLSPDADPEHRALVQGGVRQWNDAIAATSAKYGRRVTLLDLFPISDEVIYHPEYISPDSFHPSTVGYERLAQVVWETITREHLLEKR